ncbi:putative leucine-rich repeat-containing protein DDB_G0290503 [Mytilus edulis]
MSDIGENDSFITEQNEIDLSNDMIDNTQNGITDSQFNDQDMFNLIKSSFGQLDRKTFKHDLLKHTDTDDLRPIRNSLFDLIRNREQTYSDTKLVERTQRDNGQPLGEKLADDIYVIYQYLEGANNASELRQCVSKSKRTTTVSDETDSKMSDILNKLSNKTTSTNNENTIVLSMLMEIKQMIKDNMKPMNDKIDKLNKNFENETKMLKNKLYEKDILITNLQSQIHESRDRIGKLQAEVKLQAQQIKDKDDNINENEKQRQLNDKIISRLDVIDNKLKKQNATEKKSTKNDTSTDIVYISKQPITSENNIVLHESNSNDCDNYTEDNKIYTASKNYVDYSTLTNDLQYDEMVRPIETKVTDNDTAIFRGVVRKRTKRIVLYNVIADKPYELVSSAVKTYAEQKDVHITFTKLLKKRESRGKSTYIMRVNINEDDFFNKIETDNQFWPKGIYWRDYVPYNSNTNNNKPDSQWD